MKIKTTARAHRNTSEAFEQTEEAETQRGGRVTRRTTPYQPTENTITSNTSPNHISYQSPHSSLTNDNLYTTLQPTYSSNQPINGIESFQSDELSTKLDTSETEKQTDYERGIVPKKRRVKNKANSEVIVESTVEPIQKKQRSRRRNDDNFTETSEINSQSTDTQNVQTSDKIHELEKEPIPKKRMTAAARKQYSLPIPQQLTEIVSKPESEKSSKSSQIDVVTNSPKNRGRRVKSKPVMNSAVKVDSIGQEEKLERQTRSTRNNANDMMQVCIVRIY